MKVEMVPVSALKAADYNPRVIGPVEMAALRASIERFGAVQPLVANRRNSTIVGGHQRFQAMLDLRWQQIPVHWVDLDEAEEKRLNVTLNNPGVQGSWDIRLDELLEEIKEPDDPLNLGFLDAMPKKAKTPKPVAEVKPPMLILRVECHQGCDLAAIVDQIQEIDGVSHCAKA